jgi:hypothetical protein
MEVTQGKMLVSDLDSESALEWVLVWAAGG